VQSDATKDRMSAMQIKTLVRSVIETILQKHIEPPTRQQMVLEAARQLGVSLNSPVSWELSLAISDARDSVELYKLFLTELQRQIDSDVETSVVLKSVEIGIDRLLVGGLDIDTRSNVQAEEQIAANRYVGIGVTVAALRDGKGMQFNKVFEGGAAFSAGILDADMLESVDGKSTVGRSLVEVIEWLRGAADTTVILAVRSKGEPSRELKLVRRVVPLKSLELIEKNATDSALHIKVNSFSASSVTELQNIVFKSEADGGKWNTIVLDIQNAIAENLHFLHLFADGILNETVLCKIQTRNGIRSLNTEEGRVLDDKRIVILYRLGQSEILDLFGQACVKADIPVFFWEPDLNKSVAERGVIAPGENEAFAVAGTEYFIKITASRLLDKNGRQVNSTPSDDGLGAKPSEPTNGKPLLRKEGSVLNCILLELKKIGGQ